MIFKPKIFFKMNAGRFLIKTIETSEELKQAFRLRFQVFQVEMIGQQDTGGEDQDEFDLMSDHLAIIDTKSQLMVATCRLNCSLFSDQFYSAQEFDCEALIARPETKLEIGRVCVHRDFRRGIIIILLWRCIAAYMQKAQVAILFGCGSVMTEDPYEALILYKYLVEENKVRAHLDISPRGKYRSSNFEKLLLSQTQSLTHDEKNKAQALLPPLCKSYFDIGCYVPGPPAFDRDFKCVDFLTILESSELDPKVRQKMMGSTA